MADEPAPIPLDALDLESLSDEELQRLTQLLMSERERRMGLEPGPKDPLSALRPWAPAWPRPAMSGW
jgi:hypothetical protein